MIAAKALSWILRFMTQEVIMIDLLQLLSS